MESPSAGSGDLFIVLLAGGIGSRLAPLSQNHLPKQFLALPGQDKSLLQQAAQEALSLVPAERVVTVGMVEHAGLLRDQLAAIDPVLSENILLEPCGRGTAAAACVAALYVQKAAPGAVLWLLPCDHARMAPLALRDYLPMVKDNAADAILLFGVKPYSADAGYGYVRTASGNASPVLDVVEFVEKPPAEKIHDLLENGDIWWNSGMFVMRAHRLLTLLAADLPDMLEDCRAASDTGSHHGGATYLDIGIYSSMKAQSLDVGIMEKAPNLKLAPLSEGWADIGTWPRLLAWWNHYAPHHPHWDFGAGKKVFRPTAAGK